MGFYTQIHVLYKNILYKNTRFWKANLLRTWKDSLFKVFFPTQDKMTKTPTMFTIKNMLRIFLKVLNPKTKKKLRTSQGFLDCRCSNKKKWKNVSFTKIKINSV